jgi:hypothetical protein
MATPLEKGLVFYRLIEDKKIFVTQTSGTEFQHFTDKTEAFIPRATFRAWSAILRIMVLFFAPPAGASGFC